MAPLRSAVADLGWPATPAHQRRGSCSNPNPLSLPSGRPARMRVRSPAAAQVVPVPAPPAVEAAVPEMFPGRGPAVQGRPCGRPPSAGTTRRDAGCGLSLYRVGEASDATSLTEDA